MGAVATNTILTLIFLMPVQLHHCLTFQGDENLYYNTDELSNTDILRSALDTVRTTEQLLSY